MKEVKNKSEIIAEGFVFVRRNYFKLVTGYPSDKIIFAASYFHPLPPFKFKYFNQLTKQQLGNHFTFM
jgi:hypothetical protein